MFDIFTIALSKTQGKVGPKLPYRRLEVSKNSWVSVGGPSR